MNTILVLLVFVYVFHLLLTKFDLGWLHAETRPMNLGPYLSKNPLTPTETIFYHRLVAALPEHIVLAQVQLSSFLQVDKTQIKRQNYYKWFTPISQQSIDFLICSKDFSIIAAVELDDKSHNLTKAIIRDDKKNINLAAANIRLIRWHAEAMPETETIQRAIRQLTDIDSTTTTNQPQWLTDRQQTFFKQTENSNGSLSQKLVFGAVVIGIGLWIIPNAIHNFTASITTQTKILPLAIKRGKEMTAPADTMQLPDKNYEQNIAAQNLVKTQAHQAQQVLIQQQYQHKIVQRNDEALKEEIWNRDYKKFTACPADEHMVECGNRYIKARAEFERYWLSNNKN